MEHRPEHADVVSPVLEPYLPAGHGVQAAVVAPPVENDPRGQLPEQADVVDPPRPYVPAGHAAVHVELVSPAEEP